MTSFRWLLVYTAHAQSSHVLRNFEGDVGERRGLSTQQCNPQQCSFFRIENQTKKTPKDVNLKKYAHSIPSNH